MVLVESLSGRRAWNAIHRSSGENDSGYSARVGCLINSRVPCVTSSSPTQYGEQVFASNSSLVPSDENARGGPPFLKTFSSPPAVGATWITHAGLADAYATFVPSGVIFGESNSEELEASIVS